MMPERAPIGARSAPNSPFCCILPQEANREQLISLLKDNTSVLEEGLRAISKGSVRSVWIHRFIGPGQPRSAIL